MTCQPEAERCGLSWLLDLRLLGLIVLMLIALVVAVTRYMR